MNCNSDIDVSAIKIDLIRTQVRTYQVKLNEQVQENNRMKAEIEKLEAKAQQFVLNKAHWLEEIAEGKSLFALLTKEVEIKKKFLEVVMKGDAKRIKENNEESIDGMIKKIEDMSTECSKIIQTKGELNCLKALKEINGEDTNRIMQRLCL